MSEYQKAPRGCSFLLREVGSETILTPEGFTEHQLMFAQTAADFMEREVLPHAHELEKGNFDLMVEKLHKAAELGLLMIDIPEAYGGLQVDKTTSMLVTEKLSVYSGFATSYGAHTGIGMLPLLYFGTEAQKKEWLPKFATGEVLGAYALTEPGSGSDALAAKTRAELTEDGEHYVLNGSKMWITNAGFADLFTVFAQVDGDKFTAFLVEADRAGVSTGAEEKKMGLKGSSTRLLVLENVRIPRANLLGEIGKGHKIAFNVLNVGRFKLGVGVLGAGKRALKLSIDYAKERIAFGQPIANFGAIQAKIGEMVAQLYALESSCYRVAGYMDESMETIDAADPEYSEKSMRAIEEFAIEDSIMKVLGSEILGFVTDEAVQIHGGMGYSAEYEVERAYRDARINRIFEGTNEINRMLIPGMILKRTMKGQLNLFEVIQRVEATLADDPATPPSSDTLDYDAFLVERAKLLSIYVANHAIQKHMADLKDQQEILMALADLLIDVYAMDSAVARTLQLAKDQGADAVALQRAATRLYLVDALGRVVTGAETLARHLATSDEALDGHFEAIDALSVRPRVDTITLRKQLAKAAIEREKYPL